MKLFLLFFCAVYEYPISKPPLPHRGFFMLKFPLFCGFCMAVESDPLTTIGIIIAFALVLSIFFKRIGQNPVLGFIVSGFLLGPVAFGVVKPDDVLVTAFSELGL